MSFELTVLAFIFWTILPRSALTSSRVFIEQKDAKVRIATSAVWAPLLPSILTTGMGARMRLEQD
jgi:hypothetical protein